MKRKTLFTTALICGAVIIMNTLVGWMNKPALVSEAEIKSAAGKSFLLLQQSSYVFTNNAKFKCAACHHNPLTSMVAEIAVEKGIQPVDSFTTHRIGSMVGTIIGICNPNLINQVVAVNFIPPYMLFGLAAEKYPADFNTDIAIDYIMSQQKADGSFLAESGRPPLETGEMHLTAMDVRAIQLYAAHSKKEKAAVMIAKAKQWIEKTSTDNQQELAFQLLGMQWCGSDAALKTKVAKKLKAMQNKDGGWSQLPTMNSDAYATGQVLYALYEADMLKPEDPVYQKGLKYLLDTQDGEGAWVVHTRAYPIQPFVNSQFPPYDENQFISATASNWAAMALMNALPDKGK